jgi:ATP-dependent DNA helicase PIF1
METLNEEQLKAFQAIQSGKSIFLTGPGGTGKSYLIKQIYEKIPDLTGKQVDVTAMTGCAALLIGKFAKTLHSWSGMGLGRDSVDIIVRNIKKSGRAKQRWKLANILIIDEVSMMTSELLGKLDEVARIMKKCTDKPIGGLQVVFVGDFYQLPPVFKGVEGDNKFLFESPLWSQIVQESIELTQIVRQSDPAFQKILNEARIGKLSENSIEVLKSRQNLPWKRLPIKPTLLFSRRAEVNMINETNFKALEGERKIFKAESVYDVFNGADQLTRPEIKNAIERLDKSAPYMTELVLAVGAQVMLLKNRHDIAGLMNGSRGVVMSFDPISGEPFVKFLSGVTIPIGKDTWESEEIHGLKRKQIPLNLAYAVTIHKSQGATLDLALIDIGRSTFECGQAYVALSRVKSLESLYIWNFEPSEIRANKKVIEFYSK